MESPENTMLETNTEDYTANEWEQPILPNVPIIIKTTIHKYCSNCEKERRPFTILSNISWCDFCEYEMEYMDNIDEDENTLDYLAMSKVRTKIIEKELIIKALHPSRISKWLDYHLANGENIYDFEY